MNHASESAAFAIVVGLDFGDGGGYAFERAGQLARAIPGSQIHLLHVFEKVLDAAQRNQILGQLRLYVNEKATSLGGLVGVTVGIHLRAGDPVREILQLATDIRANLIVVGTRKGPHLNSWLLGAVAHRLLHSTACPVLVAGPNPPPVPHAPEIEPACPDCLSARSKATGASWWCPRHAGHAIRAHVYSYQREQPLASHDSEVIPTGIDF